MGRFDTLMSHHLLVLFTLDITHIFLGATKKKIRFNERWYLVLIIILAYDLDYSILITSVKPKPKVINRVSEEKVILNPVVILG